MLLITRSPGGKLARAGSESGLRSPWQQNLWCLTLSLALPLLSSGSMILAGILGLPFELEREYGRYSSDTTTSTSANPSVVAAGWLEKQLRQVAFFFF